MLNTIKEFITSNYGVFIFLFGSGGVISVWLNLIYKKSVKDKEVKIAESSAKLAEANQRKAEAEKLEAAAKLESAEFNKKAKALEVLNEADTVILSEMMLAEKKYNKIDMLKPYKKREVSDRVMAWADRKGYTLTPEQIDNLIENKISISKQLNPRPKDEPKTGV